MTKCLIKVLTVCGLLTGGLFGQLPLGILEGRLGRITSTQLSVTLEDGRLLECMVDGRTYVDRNRERLQLKDLKVGDFLELVTERQGAGGKCFARMIHVVGLEKRFGGRGKMGEVRRSTESFAPRGSVYVTGVVRQVQEGFLEIKTKQEGVMRFRLRPDTIFLNNGAEVKAGSVDRTQPVSVRAGHDLNGDLEAYQVTWGAIVQPTSPLPRQ